MASIASDAAYPPRPLTLEATVSLMTDAEIALLNARYRRKNRPTDVLSFALGEGEQFPAVPGAFSPDAFSPKGEGPETEVFALGDIVISIETAQRQARERNHDVATEVAFLVTHGALHLLGYDHATSSQRRIMWKQQERLLEQLQASG